MKHPSGENHNIDKAGGGPDSEAAPDASRRRFVIAGVVAAPLLVTLAAKPAEATGVGGGTLGNYGSKKR